MFPQSDFWTNLVGVNTDGQMITVDTAGQITASTRVSGNITGLASLLAPRRPGLIP